MHSFITEDEYSILKRTMLLGLYVLMANWIHFTLMSFLKVIFNVHFDKVVLLSSSNAAVLVDAFKNVLSFKPLVSEVPFQN